MNGSAAPSKQEPGAAAIALRQGRRTLTGVIATSGGVAFAAALALAWRASSATARPSTTVGAARAPSSPATAERAIELAADAPIRQIRVGSRVIAVDPPAASVTIRLGATGPRELEAIAANGRHVELYPSAGEGELAVRFRDAPTPSRPGRLSRGR